MTTRCYDFDDVGMCKELGIELPTTLLLRRGEALRLLREHGIAGRGFLRYLDSVQLSRDGNPSGRRYYLRHELAILILEEI